MKIAKISRKSFVIYFFVFCIMLLFEAQRLNPLLEREGAKFPVLLEAETVLRDLGEKSGIYAFNRRVHDSFEKITQAEIFSRQTNLAPALAAAWENFRQGKNYLAQIRHRNETKTPLVSETQSPAENLPQENIKESAVPSEQAAPAPKNGIAETNTVTAETAAQENAQAIPQENISAEQRTDGQNSAEPKPAEEETYHYNSLNFPYLAELEEKTETGFAVYHVQIPDYGKKKTVLLVGDSMMMEGLGPTLHHRLRLRDNLDVYREGKYSSGLSRPDFFDWPTNLKAMLEKYHPDLLIVSLGANDTQDIVIDKKRYFIDTKAWEEIYLQRSKDFIALADNGKRHILWVSLPVMGKEPYFTRTKLITKLQDEASQTVKNASFVNIQHLLTENGKYTTFYKNEKNQSIRLRSQDLIHVSSEGGEILTDYVLPRVDSHLNALYAEDVKFSYPPVAGKANHVVFASRLRQKQAEYYIWLPETGVSLKKQPESPLDVRKAIAEQLGGKKYPVLYLLHGATGSGRDFADNMGQKLQEIATQKKVIIVAPSCEPFGWYVNSPYIADSQIADFIVEELVPHIDSLYPTNKKRGIAGLSMGGHGALRLGFYNRTVFQSMASISGVLDITAHTKNWHIKDLLGNYEDNKKLWEENCVVNIIADKWPATSPKHIQIVTGKEDSLVLEENRKAQSLLTKRGFKFEYKEETGGHNWDFWNAHIPQILSNQADWLNK